MIPRILRLELRAMWESLLIATALTLGSFVVVSGLGWIL